MIRAPRLCLIVVAAVGFGGCSLVVDFDRSLLLDGGPDGGVDAAVEAAIDGEVDAGDNAAVDAGADPN